jgi:hypothetical protein
MTGVTTASAHLLSPRKLMLALSGLVHQIISGDAAETAPTETTTAFRGLFEQTRGVAARSTTSDHLVVLEDSHNRYPPSSAVSSFGRDSNARL